MTEWWNGLDGFDKTLWAITLVATLIFVIQSIATFMGMDSHGDVDADFSGDMETHTDSGDHHDGPFQLFTLRNLVNFFLGFGWTVLALQDNIENRGLLLAIGVLVGAGLVTLIMYMFFYLSKLAESGNMNIHNALGHTVQVYLTIPAHKNGMGKVHAKIQNSLHEIDAMTDGEAIPSGSMARVKEIIDNNLFLVEKV